jgi:hypothetical protein
MKRILTILGIIVLFIGPSCGGFCLAGISLPESFYIKRDSIEFFNNKKAQKTRLKNQFSDRDKAIQKVQLHRYLEKKKLEREESREIPWYWMVLWVIIVGTIKIVRHQIKNRRYQKSQK